jgi:hypothetical protein
MGLRTGRLRSRRTASPEIGGIKARTQDYGAFTTLRQLPENSCFVSGREFSRAVSGSHSLRISPLRAQFFARCLTFSAPASSVPPVLIAIASIGRLIQERIASVKHILPIAFASACLLAQPSYLNAQSNAAGSTPMSRGELRKLEREATTASQFKLLAAYYRQAEQKFRAKAAEEKIEWQRRSRNITGPSAKPPRPVDSARNLYEYYEYEADHAARLATRYERSGQAGAAPDGPRGYV